jgi:outer membrane protein TolC
MQRKLLAVMGAALALSLAITGCTAAHYKASADREVYSIVKQKTSFVPGMARSFTIDPSPMSEQRVCPPATAPAGPASPTPAAPAAPAAAGQTVPAAGAQAPAGAGAAQPAGAAKATLISLAKALEIAAYNSRTYQSQKESVFLSALTLTSQRFNFGPQFSGTGGGAYTDTGTGTSDSISGNTALGLTWLLKTGTQISTELSTDFSRTINGHPVEASSSLFNFTVTQPILQGAGVAVTAPLTQAERNVVYQMRSFVEFRRQFFVQVLSDYYGVLENLQVLANQEENYQSLKYARDQAQALSEAGKLPTFQVDQAQQNMLQAEDNVLRARQSYESSLDSFKFELGLPPEANVELDPAELQRLTQEKAEALPFTLDQAVAMALDDRLDLMTANDQVEDAQRNVAVAANGLLPALNLDAGTSSTTSGTNQPLNFTSNTTNFNAGFTVDLGLTRLNQRNTYRSSLISLDLSTRNQCQVRDSVVQQVRNTWRQFQRTNSSYRIASASVDLARRQVDSTEMLLQAGRAIIRDVLDAQSALLSAQNNLAAAIVDYRVARLDLAVNMDILYVSETGQLKESFDEYFRPQSQ